MPFPGDVNKKINDVLNRHTIFFPSTSDRDTWQPHSSTALSTTVIETIQIPRGVNAVLVQAVGGDIRYTLTPTAAPSVTSGFKLWDGNDPIAIAVVEGMVLQFIAEDAGAVLESQLGRMF